MSHSTPRPEPDQQLQPKEQHSLLLTLPAELQLNIYELAIIEEDTLLLNVACNSSYRNRHLEMKLDIKAWAEGEKHAPFQPPLTRTCTSIRNMTLPIFYQENTFRPTIAMLRN